MTLRKAGGLLALAAVLFIAVMTLEPRPEDEPVVSRIPPTCLICGRLGGVDVILNVILFLPLGAGLALAGMSFPRAVLMGLATTLTVEALQVWVVPGRDASLSDLITNTSGTALGAAAAAHWRHWFRPPPSRAAWFAAGWAGAWLGQAAMAAWALQPDLPPTTWYGQHAPDLGQFDRFRGTLLQARLDGQPMPVGRLDGASIRPLVDSGSLRLEARAQAGTAPARLAPIASIFDQHENEVAVLGQSGEALVFRARLRTARLRLRTPALALPGAMAGLEPADNFAARGTLAPGRLSVELSTAGASASRSMALSPHLGWALLLPYDRPLGSEVPLLTWVWLAGLLLPLGWWAAQAEVGLAALLGSGAVLGTGLVLLPLNAGLPPAPTGEWCAALAGVGAGALLSRAAARWRPAA